MKLEFDKAEYDIVPQKIITKVKDYKNVVVFGAGMSGEWVVNLLRKNGIFPKMFCDNYAAKWGKHRSGLLIESFERALSLYPDAAICVASMWVEDILEQIKLYNPELLSRTWNLLTTMAWETTGMLYVSGEKKYIEDNFDELVELYDELADEKSKETLEGILNYRLTRDASYLQMIKSDEITYLDRTIITEEIVQKIQKRILIDGGAFDGDTVELFVRCLGGQISLNIHCYEPEGENCQKLKRKLSQWNGHQVTLHKAALWNGAKADAAFEGNGLSGKIKEGISDIRTEFIDGYPYGTVGMIKLDIEGAEREALEGARKLIERDKPILAICAYHLQDDLLVLFDFIKSLKCNYKIMLRHYMNSSGDTIMYAIPKSMY